MYPPVIGRRSELQTFCWTDRDYLLYALAIGLGGDPLNAAELPFVYERGMKVVPSFPTVIAWLVEPTFASLGASPDSALHAGQKIELHEALIKPATVAVTGEVVAVQDKGRERGALIVTRHEVAAAEGTRIATLTTSCFARDCGGVGSAGEPPTVHGTVPSREPDLTVSYGVRPDAALLYRLTGDRNPLHAGPTAARRAGFPRPILHGLCTFGMACRAVLELIVDWQPECIASQEARFTAPVYPGETLEISLWRQGDSVFFQASVPARQAIVTFGKTQLR